MNNPSTTQRINAQPTEPLLLLSNNTKYLVSPDAKIEDLLEESSNHLGCAVELLCEDAVKYDRLKLFSALYLAEIALGMLDAAANGLHLQKQEASA